MANAYKARFQIVGTIQKIGEVQTFSSGFQKREVVVNTNTQRPSPISLQLFKEDCDKADGLSIGDEVTVDGAINGREWNGPNGTRIFSDLIIKSIMVSSKADPVATQADDDAMPF